MSTLRGKIVGSSLLLMILSLIITGIISNIVLWNMLLERINKYNLNNLKTVYNGFNNLMERSEMELNNISETITKLISEYYKLNSLYERISYGQKNRR